MARRCCIYPVATPEDVATSRQLEERGFWVDVEHDWLGARIKYPGSCIRASETASAVVEKSPACWGAQRGSVWRTGAVQEGTADAQAAGSDIAMEKGKQALEGLKVADFSWFISGPLVAKFLGDYGAEVVHIESGTRPDNMRSTLPMKDNVPGINRSAAFARYNSSKYGISLNLANPKGVEIARRIVAWADVVLENFSSGTMERLGLGYEELRKVNPDIIMVSLPMFGHSGPLAKHPGLGSQLADLIGFGNLTGWPDRPPVSPPGAYTDFISPYYAMSALMAALDYRHRTGKGQYIEVSQYEAGVQFVAPLVMDWFVHGREPATHRQPMSGRGAARRLPVPGAREVVRHRGLHGGGVAEPVRGDGHAGPGLRSQVCDRDGAPAQPGRAG